MLNLRNLVLVLLSATCLWAQPRPLGGLALRHTTYLAAPPLTLLTATSPEVPMLRDIAYEEARLWAFASSTLRHPDPAAREDITSSWLSWQRYSKIALNDQKLTSLIWLEWRWEAHLRHYRGENSAAYAQWHDWTATAIRTLQASIEEEDRNLRELRRDQPEKTPTQMAAAQDEHGLAYLQSVWAQRKNEQLQREEEEARQNDPLHSLKASVQGQQDELIKAAQTIQRLGR